MKFKAVVEYEYPIEHKPHVKAEIVLHGDRVITDNIKWVEQEPILDKIRAEMFEEMLSHSGTGEEVIQAYADGLKKD